MAKINPAGTDLVYCGYIGGSGNENFAGDGRCGIAIDHFGSVYVSGETNSDQATFPVAVGPDLTYNGGDDAFVAKVRPDGTALEYCGYIGGSGWDGSASLAVDSAGNAYVAGHTDSTEASFPVTVGPDLTHNGGWDAFVAKVNAAGTALDYCGYIGGSSHEADKGGFFSQVSADAGGEQQVSQHGFALCRMVGENGAGGRRASARESSSRASKNRLEAEGQERGKGEGVRGRDCSTYDRVLYRWRKL